MRVVHLNGLTERLGEQRKRPQFLDRYGRRKDGAPRDPETLKMAAAQDRRAEVRDVVDPLRGRLFDVTT